MQETKQPPKWSKPLEEGHVVEYAFSSLGVNYFQMHDLANSFAHRALCALDKYDQLEMRCKRDFLVKFDEKFSEALSGKSGKIDINDFHKLRTVLSERLAFAIPPSELIYEFASVAFFDENESPYKYDEKYGKEKIQRWKQDETLDDFFFGSPLKNLIPLHGLSKPDLAPYLKIVDLISQKHSQHLSCSDSSTQQRNDSSSASFLKKSLQPTSQDLL